VIGLKLLYIDFIEMCFWTICSLKIPEKDYAENLKKQQSQKWAYQWYKTQLQNSL